MKKILLSLFVCAGFVTSAFAQLPVADFSGSPTTLCAGKQVSWTNLTTGAGGGSTFNWTFTGSTNPTSTNPFPGPRTYNTPGTYNVMLIVDNGNGIDTMLKTNYITVLASPTITVSPSTGYICSVGSTTLTASGGNSYVWSPSTGLNTTSGATVIASPGNTTNYTVTGANANGCTSQAFVTVSVNNSAPANPGGITGPTTVCAGQSGVTYSVAGVTPPAPYRTWTVPSGAVITAGQGTRSVTVTFGGTSGNVCCTASNACGSSSPSCQAITVNPTPAVGTVGTITGPKAVCANQSGITFSIAPVANAASYNWTVNGGSNATITAGQGTNTITVDFSVNNCNLCVTASNSCNTSNQVCIGITASPSTPAIPGAITGPTTVCNGQANVVYTVGTVANAQTYTWAAPAGSSIVTGQGTRTVTITFGATSGTVSVTAGNACGTSLASTLNVTVDPSPALGAIGTISGPTAVCANQSNVTYTVGAAPNATNYNWTVPGTATVTAGAGTNTITVDFGGGGGNICVTANNGCYTGSQVCQSITVSPSAPGIPGAITGPTTVCNGSAGVLYSVASVPNATVYTWTVPTGASVTAGQGTRFATVTFGATSGTVAVTAGNACGTSLASTLNVTVDPAVAVGTVGTITGPTAVCANQSGVTYSVGAVTGATTYSWTVPGTATVTAGQGTNTITVSFGGGAGTICVTASNNCSASAQSCQFVSVSPSAPAIPGAINGPTTVCNGSAGVDYFVATVPNTSVYTWTVPSGASITGGQGTKTITVTFGATSGTVSVTAGNACGTSLASNLNVTVDPNPTVGTLGTITGPTAVCQNQSNVTYTVGAVTGASTYSWTVPGTATVTAGQGTNTITVSFAGGGGNICVTASNNCSSTSANCITITVAPSAPAIPGGITGPTTVCNGTLGVVYSVGNVPNATVYTWTVPSGATVASGQGANTVTVNFGPNSGTVAVTAGNACGTSLASSLLVTVDPTPAVGTIGTITGPTAACANQTNVTYYIAPVANATNYNWTVPASANITGGQGTTTITVTFGNVSGNICVDASNSCGSAPSNQCIAVSISPNAPAIPLGITGPTTVCTSQSGVSYSIAPVPNALSYAWTVPAGASVTSGQGTTNIMVTFGATSGTVSVTAGNGCGNSLASTLVITVSSAVLTVSTTPTNATCGSCCDGSATATPSGGTGPYNYAWNPTGAVTQSITGLCTGTYTVCVTDAGGCVTCNTVTISAPIGVATVLTDNGTLKVYPNPANDYVFLEGTLSGSANMQVSVINLYGQKMIGRSVFANGAFSEKVNIANIAPGIYFIEVRSGEMVRNLKIVKVQ